MCSCVCVCSVHDVHLLCVVCGVYMVSVHVYGGCANTWRVHVCENYANMLCACVHVYACLFQSVDTCVYGVCTHVCGMHKMCVCVCVVCMVCAYVCGVHIVPVSVSVCVVHVQLSAVTMSPSLG